MIAPAGLTPEQAAAGSKDSFQIILGKQARLGCLRIPPIVFRVYLFFYLVQASHRRIALSQV